MQDSAPTTKPAGTPSEGNFFTCEISTTNAAHRLCRYGFTTPGEDYRDHSLQGIIHLTRFLDAAALDLRARRGVFLHLLTLDPLTLSAVRQEVTLLAPYRKLLKSPKGRAFTALLIKDATEPGLRDATSALIGLVAPSGAGKENARQCMKTAAKSSIKRALSQTPKGRNYETLRLYREGEHLHDIASGRSKIPAPQVGWFDMTQRYWPDIVVHNWYVASESKLG